MRSPMNKRTNERTNERTALNLRDRNRISPLLPGWPRKSGKEKPPPNHVVGYWNTRVGSILVRKQQTAVGDLHDFLVKERWLGFV